MASESFFIQVPPQDPWQLSSLRLQKLSTPQLYRFHEQQNSDPDTGLDVGVVVGFAVGKDVGGKDVGFFVGEAVGLDVPQGAHKEHFAHVHFCDHERVLSLHQLLQAGAFVGAIVFDLVGTLDGEIVGVRVGVVVGEFPPT